MKKEKQVKTYQRRTKSGKMVTVRAHTAKYDAADKAQEIAKKKGAGDELEEKKKKKFQLDLFSKEEMEGREKEKDKKADDMESTKKSAEKPKEKAAKVAPKKETKQASSEPAFTAAEFKEWYRGTGSAADKKVAKALRAQLGRSGYRKLEDEAISNYTSRGHLSMFKKLGSMRDSSTPIKVEKSKVKDTPVKPSPLHPHDMYEYSAKDKKRMDTLLPKINKMQKDWETKYGSRENTPAAKAHLKKLNSLESEYQKLINSSKKETSAYSKYKEDYAAWSKYDTAQKKQKEISDKKSEKQKYMTMAEKKGLQYVGTRGGVMVWHKNGKPYIENYGKITSLDVPKTIKNYVSKKLGDNATKHASGAKVNTSRRTKRGPLKAPSSIAESFSGETRKSPKSKSTREPKLIYSSDFNVYKRDSKGELKKVGKWDGKNHEVIKNKSK